MGTIHGEMEGSAKFEANFPAITRLETVSQIITQVREGNFAQVVGTPGTGRSNLVGLLAYNKNLRLKHLGEEDEKAIHFVPLNFSEIRGKVTTEALKFLYLSILDSLHERGMHGLGGELERLYPRDETEELRISQVLKRAIDYLTLEKNLKLVLLFDHFEEYIPTVAEAFFAHIAALQIRARYHCSIVFFLHRPLEQLVTPDVISDVLKLLSGRTIFLPVKDQPLVDYLFSHTEESLGKSLSPEMKKRISTATGGHAKLVKVVAEEALSASYEDVDSMLRENRAIRSVLYEIWGIFYPEEQALLRRLSVSENEEDSTQIKQEALSYLMHLEVIRDKKFTIPVFAEFVRYRAEHQLDEKIHYNDEAKKLYKGDVDLTERLTAAEFAVLRFLLQEQDRIITRDEIIAAGWSALKSTAGVTEQAIDQLLFRLRQKIEDDPSNPRHLITVKGRGVKFVP